MGALLHIMQAIGHFKAYEMFDFLRNQFMRNKLEVVWLEFVTLSVMKCEKQVFQLNLNCGYAVRQKTMVSMEKL